MALSVSADIAHGPPARRCFRIDSTFRMMAQPHPITAHRQNARIFS
ncbi:hypothetical protein TC41_0199 [Alicyclobacillus acidocaldarius subsp. acidocaldarius Tc-4-1]|uniref:Uncharacterized protein n=1 Tax=Alicyclobacillus acidocaldarius (strain Tc-4-1) TaxID=1048834 RepID=F8IJ25_ALIAT|nr:hypothetical protein TC41_0199 [Alicyclobacillus acidocaldarius subsp. acidocaldarius Tc-4-1]